MDGEHAVVGLLAHQLQPRLREFGPDHAGERTADGEEDHRRDEVGDPERLVIGGGQPAHHAARQVAVLVRAVVDELLDRQETRLFDRWIVDHVPSSASVGDGPVTGWSVTGCSLSHWSNSSRGRIRTEKRIEEWSSPQNSAQTPEFG